MRISDWSSDVCSSDLAAVLRSAALLLLLMTCRAALAAAPQVVTIAGHPLTLYIGDDASLQTVNDQVPGTGQFYPSDSAESTPQTADAEIGRASCRERVCQYV